METAGLGTKQSSEVGGAGSCSVAQALYVGFGQGRDKGRWNYDENGGSAHLLATENPQAQELAEVPL